MTFLIAAGIILACIIAAALIVSAVFLVFVIADAKRNFREDCDFLMILGGNVFGADTPSPQLLQRMKEAAKYLNENPHVTAVPCGGCFRDGQKKSEAAIIADFLVSQGISPSRIALEDKSTTTFENFIFASPIIEKLGGKDVNRLRVAFLSSDYHLHRAALIAKMCGIKNPLRVSCPTPAEAYKRYLREPVVAWELLGKLFKKG